MAVGLSFEAVSGSVYQIIDQITSDTFLGKKVRGCKDDPVFVKYWDTGALWLDGNPEERLKFSGCFGEIGSNKRLVNVEFEREIC